MALAIFDGLLDRLKPDPINIDNLNFKLHSKLSVGTFISASAVSMLTSYFGTEIKCFGSNKDFVESNCWLHGSYHIGNTLLDAAINRGETCFSPSPNQILVNGERVGGDSEQSDTSYYIWVSWMLLINAALFILPNQLWRYLEGGMMQRFSLNNDRDQREDSDEDNDVEATDLRSNGARSDAENFTRVSVNAKKTYFWKFIAMECLNLAIVIVNFFVIDTFLDGKFHNYGMEVFKYATGNKEEQEFQGKSETHADVINPMCNLFPTMVSCPTKTGAVNGGVDSTSDLCILSQNLVNQIIYTILWCWFMILFLSNGLMIIYRIIIIINVADARGTSLRLLMKTSNEKKNPMNNLIDATERQNKLKIGEWFLLAQIGQNSNHHYFRDVMEVVVNLRNERNGFEMSAGETSPMNVENEQINIPANQNGNTEDDESSDTKKTTLMNGETTHINGKDEKINSTTNENGNAIDGESSYTKNVAQGARSSQSKNE